MKQTLPGPAKPKFRDAVGTSVRVNEVELSLGAHRCSFEFSETERDAVNRLISDLEFGGFTPDDLAERSPEIAEQIPSLLIDFDRLRLLVESDAEAANATSTGVQLYREVRRVADRVIRRVAKSSFYNALLNGQATRQQLIGYALEYYWIVQAAPGLIAPALATARTSKERSLLQDFLKSELGHDRFLRTSLESVGLIAGEVENHQPLPATFCLGASLGVYARQHPLSFKACLFLFEEARPEFVDAFDDRCRALDLPVAFYAPLRQHADINTDYNHEDISRSLMELENSLDLETCTVVRRHVALLIETMIQQEEQILSYYGRQSAQLPRLFN
ncbi:MAG: hypothetical protein ACR2H4_19895 [Pyrinomonadaceae bacterium]